MKRKQPRGNEQEYMPDIHRMLPASPDGEMGVLSSCLLSKEAIGLCVERLVDDEWFHIPAHATIYEVIVTLWNTGKPTDFIAVTAALKSEGFLDVVGGHSFITNLFTFLPTAANVGYYLDILEEKRMLREVIKTGTKYAASAYDEQQDALQLLDDYEKASLAIRKIQKAKRANVRALVHEVLTRFDDAHTNPGRITGLSTGFKKLDVQIDGLQPEFMYVLAARPGCGKTALAMGIAEHLAIDLKIPIAIFSLEMSALQLTQRLICSMAYVNYHRFKAGYVSQRDLPAIAAAASKVIAAEHRLIIDDASGQSIQEIRAKARRMKSENGIQAVFIDYLQLMRSNTKRGGENRQVEVTEISTGCKELARELGLPVVVLAQLNRGPEKDAGRKPRLTDLRESGSIEQDADMVGLIMRPELFAEDEETRIALEGKATLTIAKQRSGPIGDVELQYISEFTRFKDVEREPEQPEQMTLAD